MQADPALLSFAELRERHLALLREWNAAAEALAETAAAAAEAKAVAEADMSAEPADLAGDLSADLSAEAEGAGGSREDETEANGRLPLAPAAEALRAAAAALGGWLDDAEERDRAQGVIDYWTSALASLPGREFPQLLHLALFDPALPAAAVEQAEAIFAGHEGTAREADAEAMLSCLVRPGPGDTIVCRPPVERTDLEHADGVTDMTASQGELIDALVAAGVIRRQAGDTPAQDRFDFTHGSVARAWPRMRGLLERRRSANATRDKLLATANLWKESRRDSGYLLTGPVLDEAGRYFGEDKELDEFLLASRHNETRWKRLRLAGWILGPVLAVALLSIGGVAGFDAGNTFGFRKGESQGIVAGAEISAGSGVTIAAEAPDTVEDLVAEDLTRIRTEVQPARPRGAPGINGWIWIGDSEIRLLRWLDSRQPVAADRVRIGLAYRTRTRVRLRGEAPEGNSGPGIDMGLMPPGALGVATGRPVRVNRARGPQYWLPVTLVPKVRIQYTFSESQVLADLFAARMRAAGFDVDPPGLNQGANVMPLLNYFRKDDGPVAARAAGLVTATLQRPDGAPPEFTCALVANPNIGTGILDLTLDFQGLSLREGRGAGAEGAPQCG